LTHIELKFKEANHAARNYRRHPPPRPPIQLPLDQLWNLISDDQRQRTLVTLTSIVLRQLDVPRDEREVRNERS
jgi:hypothetical protein